MRGGGGRETFVFFLVVCLVFLTWPKDARTKAGKKETVLLFYVVYSLP